MEGSGSRCQFLNGKILEFIVINVKCKQCYILYFYFYNKAITGLVQFIHLFIFV